MFFQFEKNPNFSDCSLNINQFWICILKTQTECFVISY